MTGLMSRAYHVYGKLLSIIGLIRYQALERQFVYTMRIGLVVSTTLLTLITAILISERGLIGLAVVGGIAALCVMIFVYHYIEVAVFGLIIVSTIINPTLVLDITITLLLLIVIVVVWLFKLLLNERSFRSIRPAPPNKFIILFIICVFISYSWSSLYVDPAVRYLQDAKFLPRLTTFIVLILSPVVILLYGNFLRSPAAVKRVIWYYVAFGTAGLIISLTNSNALVPIINMRGQLGAWIGILALGQVLFNQQLSRLLRLGLLAVVAGWAHVQIGLGVSWLSGWLPLLLGVGVLLFLKSRWLIALGMILVVLYGVANQETFLEDFEAEQKESGGSRMDAFDLALEQAGQHYLFGIGPTGPYFYLMTYSLGHANLSHNNYLDILGQTGVIGFTVYILLWFSVGWTAWKVYRLSPRLGFQGGLAASLLAIFPVTMVLMALGDWVTPFTYIQTVAGISYTIWPWMWAGITVALYHQLRQGSSETTEVNPAQV